MWRFGTVVAMVCVGALGVAGCGDDDKTTATTAASSGQPATVHMLAGRTFTSTAVEGHDLAPGTKLELAFEDGRLSVNAGCNQLGADVAVDDGTLRWKGKPFATQMACEPAVQAQDEWITGLLKAGVEATGTEKTLTLVSGDVRIELAEAATSGPPPVIGTAWTLERTFDGDGNPVRVAKGIEPPTLQLSDDGTATVFTGCNRGQGPAKVKGAFIDFGPLRLTKKACSGAAGQLEREVVSILDGKVAFGFEGASLAIANSGRHLIYSAAE